MGSYRPGTEAAGGAIEISPAARESVAHTPRYSLPLGDQTQGQGAARERDGVIRAGESGERGKMRSCKHGHAVEGQPELQLMQSAAPGARGHRRWIARESNGGCLDDGHGGRCPR